MDTKAVDIKHLVQFFMKQEMISKEKGLHPRTSFIKVMWHVGIFLLNVTQLAHRGRKAQIYAGELDNHWLICEPMLVYY